MRCASPRTRSTSSSPSAPRSGSSKPQPDPVGETGQRGGRVVPSVVALPGEARSGACRSRRSCGCTGNWPTVSSQSGINVSGWGESVKSRWGKRRLADGSRWGERDRQRPQVHPPRAPARRADRRRWAAVPVRDVRRAAHGPQRHPVRPLPLAARGARHRGAVVRALPPVAARRVRPARRARRGRVAAHGALAGAPRRAAAGRRAPQAGAPAREPVVRGRDVRAGRRRVGPLLSSGGRDGAGGGRPAAGAPGSGERPGAPPAGAAPLRVGAGGRDHGRASRLRPRGAPPPARAPPTPGPASTARGARRPRRWSGRSRP